VSSAPKAAGLEAKVSGGDLSTMDTVFSPHPHAQLHNQLPSDFAVEEILRNRSIGCEYIWANKARKMAKKSKRDAMLAMLEVPNVNTMVCTTSSQCK
jgi:hypothetical protein